MSGRIPRHFIDDLLVRVDIVELVDSHLPLKKTGSNFVARCPFHNEKTPSFSVNRKRQIYHCFGCGASGNAISFLMEYSHLGFVEAVEDLAAFVGVDVPRDALAGAALVDSDRLGRLYALLERVAAFYAEQLKSSDGRRAVEYLKARGVSGDIARDFALGYAPEKWELLPSRFDREALIDAGMLVVRDDGKVYDRFRGRLMFPIRDKRQRVIGFGGRVLDDSLPKYLNSPETAIFSKSKELYGLYEVLEKKSRPERLLIVEGYMDVIALAQYGIHNVVAALGTATSKTQIELLFRFCSELVFCFDGDNAGRQAAWKAVDAALPCLRDGRQVKIMLLPQGHDPDSLIRAEGLEGFKRRVAEAGVLSDYFFDHLSAGAQLSSLEARSQLAANAKPLLEKIPAGFFREMMLGKLSELSGMGVSRVSKIRSTLQASVGRQVRGQSLGKMSLQRRLLALLVQFPHLAMLSELAEVKIDGLEFSGRELLEEILRLIRVEKVVNSAMLIEAFRDSDHERTVNALLALDLSIPDGGESAEFVGALKQLVKQLGQEKLKELLGKDAVTGLSEDEKRLLRNLLQTR